MQIGLDTTGVASGEFLQPFEIHTWEAPVIISQIFKCECSVNFKAGPLPQADSLSHLCMWTGWGVPEPFKELLCTLCTEYTDHAYRHTVCTQIHYGDKSKLYFQLYNCIRHKPHSHRLSSQRNSITKMCDKYSTCNVVKSLFELFR